MYALLGSRVIFAGFYQKKSNIIYIHVNIYVNLVNYNNNGRFRYKMKNTL